MNVMYLKSEVSLASAGDAAFIFATQSSNDFFSSWVAGFVGEAVELAVGPTTVGCACACVYVSAHQQVSQLSSSLSNPSASFHHHRIFQHLFIIWSPVLLKGLHDSQCDLLPQTLCVRMLECRRIGTVLDNAPCKGAGTNPMH